MRDRWFGPNYYEKQKVAVPLDSEYLTERRSDSTSLMAREAPLEVKEALGAEANVRQVLLCELGAFHGPPISEKMNKWEKLIEKAMIKVPMIELLLQIQCTIDTLAPNSERAQAVFARVVGGVSRIFTGGGPLTKVAKELRLNPDEQKKVEKRVATIVNERFGSEWSNLSVWVKYCLLFLLVTPESKPYEKRASRFSQTLVLEQNESERQLRGKDNLPRQLAVSARAIDEFVGHGFPWIGGSSKNDLRLKPVKDALEHASTPIVLCNDTNQEEKRLIEHTDLPAVVYLGEVSQVDSSTGFELSAQQRQFLENQIDYRPFILAVSKPEGGEESVLTLIVNHEYFDGVMAGYAMYKISESISQHLPDMYQEVSLDNIDKRGLYLLGDEVENSSAGEDPDLQSRSKEADMYHVETTFFSPKAIEAFNRLYLAICKVNPEIVIPYGHFLILILSDHLGITHDHHGGVLKFIPDIDGMLDHYKTGDAVKVMRALIEGTARRSDDGIVQEYLKSNRYYNQNDPESKKYVFSIFREGHANMHGLLEQLAVLDIELAAGMAVVTDDVGLTRTIAGAKMVSAMPESIKIGVKDLKDLERIRSDGYHELVKIDGKNYVVIRFSGSPGPALIPTRDDSVGIYGDRKTGQDSAFRDDSVGIYGDRKTGQDSALTMNYKLDKNNLLELLSVRSKAVVRNRVPG